MLYKAPFCIGLSLLIIGQCKISTAGPSSHSVGVGSGFDFADIQTAINHARDGDTVVVSPGTYTEPVDFLKKDIVLTSTDPTNPIVRESTILAPPTSIRAWTNGSLEGFRINGEIGVGSYTTPENGATFSPRISNNHIVTENTAISFIVAYQQPAPTPIVENNVIEARTGVYTDVQAFGGGMNGIIRNNTFIGPGNTGSWSVGIQNRAHKELPVVSNNIITNFEYGYLLTYESQFAERVELFNHNNVSGNVHNYWVDALRSEWDATGVQGNISLDPGFVDFAGGDYRLRGDSLMIDAGWDSGAITDINGVARPIDIAHISNSGDELPFDIGAYEYAIPEPSGIRLTILASTLLSMAYFAKRLR